MRVGRSSAAASGSPSPGGAASERQLHVLEEHAPHQRVAVRMEARRGEPEQPIARRGSRARRRGGSSRRRRRRTRPDRTRRRRRSPAAPRSRRRAARSPPPGSRRRCRRSPARRRRPPACPTRSSRGRTAARRRRRTRSFTFIATRSMPDGVVPAGQERQLQLGAHAVGARHQQRLACSAAGSAHRPAKPPRSVITSGRSVRRTCGLMRSTSVSPASMSTPASR